jgi:hypothetical protein
MFDIRGKKGGILTMPCTALVHPDFSLALVHFCINRLQALRADTGGILDFSALAEGIGPWGWPGFLRHGFQGRAVKIHRQLTPVRSSPACCLIDHEFAANISALV